uniref:Uncharacterized protein n=1 Tax=Eptatretus burgeri TaxID=7764 RepID=A0A8C4QG25_EPTBU
MISRWQSCMLFLFLYQVAQRHECNATGSIGTVFGRVGSQVILNCSGGQAADTRVLWTHNGMQVNRVNNESSITLNLTSLSLAGHYSCIDESTQRKLRDFQLCVGYPPDKPIVSCHSFNYPDAFRCQWQPQTTQLVSFTAKYRPLPTEPEEECLIVNATTCMGTQTFLFSTTPVQLTVIASNEFGETSSTTYFILEDIVKPDPPRKVWARWRNFAYITWRAPTSWSDEELYPLMYQVRYRGQHSSQWQLVEVADFNRNIKLKELLPWEDYFVQVSAKDFLDNGFWSAWSPTLKLKAKCAVVSFVNKYAPIGSNITIPCTLPEPTGKPSKEFRKPRVIWKLNGYRLRKSSAYSLKRRRLSIQHVKPSDEGRYTCHLQRDRFRVHLVKLLVGNDPLWRPLTGAAERRRREDPPAKLNISCHSNNYPESFRCQWQPPMTFLKNNYTTKLW